MARKITHLIEEQENQAKLFKTRDLNVKVARTQQDSQNIEVPTPDKEKECTEVRIRDFDIDCVLDEETQVNVMTEKTWEAIGMPAMTPFLGGIGLFRGKLVNLCGRLAQISMNANETLT